MRIDRLKPGMVIDGFRLVEKLHQGGMAIIWKVCVDEGTDPGFPLVMKMPLIDDTDNPTLIVGFEVEQMILPMLAGPYVPRFVKNGDFAHQPYIVMEHLQGNSLYRKYENLLPLPFDEICSLGIRIAVALTALNRQNVVHLDLKPANIFLKEDGDIAFLDFGLSHSAVLPDLLAEEFSLPLGTAPYMAPEQVLGVRNEPRSDLFALGVLLYEFATGTLPFGHPKGRRGLRKRLWQDPLPPRAIRPDLPEWFQEIVLKLLNPNPKERYPTADTLAFALKNPSSVTLTARSKKLRQDGVIKTFIRRFVMRGIKFSTIAAGTGGLATAPIVAVAVDLTHEPAPLEQAVARAARRVALSEPDARIVCLTILKTARIGVDFATNDAGESYRVLRLVTLQDWARQMEFPSDRITFHVLDGADPAEELVAFVRNNNVEHLVMGARASSAVRRYLGSVSAQVVSEAPCTVTVVRIPSQERPDIRKVHS